MMKNSSEKKRKQYSYEYQKMTGERVWSPIRYKILMGELEHKEKGQLTGEISNRYNKRRYIFMLDAPFEISEQCCKVMKKGPAKQYGKETGRHPITAQMAEESYLRTSNWIKTGAIFTTQITQSVTPCPFGRNKTFCDTSRSLIFRFVQYMEILFQITEKSNVKDSSIFLISDFFQISEN